MNGMVLYKKKKGAHPSPKIRLTENSTKEESPETDPSTVAVNP